MNSLMLTSQLATVWLGTSSTIACAGIYACLEDQVRSCPTVTAPSHSCACAVQWDPSGPSTEALLGPGCTARSCQVSTPCDRDKNRPQGIDEPDLPPPHTFDPGRQRHSKCYTNTANHTDVTQQQTLRAATFNLRSLGADNK
eukprot:218604-Amphidinium_carterae.1